MSPRQSNAIYRAAFTLLVVLTVCASGGSASDGQRSPLAITAPRDGSVVRPGESFTVTVASPAGQSFTSVLVLGERFMGAIGTAESLPAQFSVSVPLDTPAGTYGLSAMGFMAAGEPTTTTMLISVEHGGAPTAIRAEIDHVVFSSQGAELPIVLLATFGEREVDVSESTRVTYVTSDPAVATVDATGRITAAGGGAATITATYRTTSGRSEARVRVIVPPPPFTVTPNQLNFGRQVVGTTATQRMTLTNTTGRPLALDEVIASSDFIAQETCMGASPLPENATCTITVSFRPMKTGVRDGVLQISDPGNRIRFQLRGTGVAAPVAPR